jgi:catechol 2,3-dioxygenase-like lactoylglutathione lyase family enzyme
MTHVTAVDYVGISVRDLEAAKRWYAMVLGFDSDYAWGEFGAEFQVGGTTVALMQMDKIGSEHTPNATALALRVDDVAVERARLEGEGVTFLDQFDSGVCHQAVFRDPDGNVLVLHHRYAPR